MMFLAFSGSSGGILPLLQLQLRPWRVTPRSRLATVTPLGLPARTRAVLTARPRRFKEERDATQHELEIISKQAGIAKLEWQHQRKQLLEAIDGESCNLLNIILILN
jgi:hypothetical protein